MRITHIIMPSESRILVIAVDYYQRCSKWIETDLGTISQALVANA